MRKTQKLQFSLTGLDVPQFDGAIVGGGDHKLGVELEAGHRRLVLVRP